MDGRKTAGIGFLVGGVQQGGNPINIQTIRRQAHRVEQHFHPVRFTADQTGDGNIGFALDPIFDLGRHPTQNGMIHTFAPEGQGQNGNIVDVAGFDQRRSHGPGNPVIVGQ